MGIPRAFSGICVLTISVTGALAAGLDPAGAAGATASSSSFAASPASAVAGQTITLTGHVPTADRRPLEVEKNDIGTWYVVGHGESRKNGSFSLTTPMGAMDPERFRVVAPRHVTGKRVERAYLSPQRPVTGIFQDVSLGDDLGRLLGAAGTALGRLIDALVSPQRFTLTAGVYPAVAHRTVTFERMRANGTWATLGSARTGGNGYAALTTTTQANATYRAVAGAYRGMSWYPSLPVALAPPKLDSSVRPADPASKRILKVQPSSATSAAQTYRWGAIGEDWNWETGQSLDPWSSYSNGTGDARIFAGMLILDSGPSDGSANDGDVTATLRATGHEYGRWEWRSRDPETGTGYLPYTMSLQLVPRSTPDKPVDGSGCAPSSIDVASFTGYSGRTTLSMSRGGTTYTRTATGTARNDVNWHTYAVEVTPQRTTWLIDHKVVASTTGTGPGVPLVPRMELSATPGVRTTHTRLSTDWVRYYPLRPSRALATGPRMSAESSPAGCR